ncbi:MAG TPA: glycoside hydrolase family 9 protein [Polyangiaceae bacterium]|jgi:endoglucanase|nr:glycoside hydrolase family 9 protein [Polyangiaceae bacterium]
MTSFSQPAGGMASVVNGALCVKVANQGQNPWDAQVRHREMVIQKGHTYTVQFRAFASAPTKARPKIGMSGAPYSEYWSSTIDVGTEPQLYSGKFTMQGSDDPTAEFAFHIGGAMARAALPFQLCIDDVRLDDPEFTRATGFDQKVAVPNVLVNEVGYLPNAAKIATVKNAASAPLDWELLNAAGAIVAEGKTSVFGLDAASGDHVHEVDFSSVRAAGQGYTLQVGADKSFAFAISPELYEKLKYDALAYFYHDRSGIEIAMPYAGDASLAHPAGHLGDESVKCLPGSGCDYALDASGGWYDAGDHGKYVVNGGISVWTLLNEYERAEFLGSSLTDFADGKLKIPEGSNHVPDILDEARWELEFLLKMQVPHDKPNAGMAHHKLTDADWTGLGTAPNEDRQPRYLHAPSTAATLNLAATAAQGARVWKTIDSGFARKCLVAAETAWAAAKANPKVYAPANDDKGGGSYADEDTSDEFYWAAAELFITTGKPEYRQLLLKSPDHQRFRTEVGGHLSSMNWGSTDALGQISLAVVPSTLDAATIKQIRARIAAAADGYLNVEHAEGYRTALQRTARGQYVWGSNSFVLNNLIVVALAYDFTKQQKYLDGAATGMDYLFGRNPLGQSYVSGYGHKPLQNPHHRFWAYQANHQFPHVPAGVVSGGPNSNIDDPYSKAAGLAGCAAEKCYVDNIEAYSVNEIAINWNAPLAWMAAFLDEKAHAPSGK